MSEEWLEFDVDREMKHLKKIVNKDDNLTITSRFAKYLIKQAERVQELDDIIEQDHRQEVLESMYDDNQRLKKRVRELEAEHKEYVAFTETNNYNIDVEMEKLYKQNKRYRALLKMLRGKAAECLLTGKEMSPHFIDEFVKYALEGEE